MSERVTVLVTLDGHPPNNNKTRRLHWYARSRSDLKWRTDAYHVALSRRRHLAGLPWERVQVRVVLGCKVDRRRDLGGVIEAAKPCIDGLVDAGIFPDDDSKHLVSLTAATEKSDSDWIRLEVTPA